MQKIVVISQYNHYMGGVDHSDRLVETYARDRWSKFHNWHRLFFHFMDLCVVNSYILYKIHHGDDSCTHKMFKKHLADQLCEQQRADYAKNKRKSREVNASNTFPMRYVNCYHEPKVETKRRCWLCWKDEKVHHDSVFSCATCGISLCMNKTRNCWNKFHKN